MPSVEIDFNKNFNNQPAFTNLHKSGQSFIAIDRLQLQQPNQLFKLPFLCVIFAPSLMRLNNNLINQFINNFILLVWLCRACNSTCPYWCCCYCCCYCCFCYYCRQSCVDRGAINCQLKIKRLFTCDKSMSRFSGIETNTELEQC